MGAGGGGGERERERESKCSPFLHPSISLSLSHPPQTCCVWSHLSVLSWGGSGISSHIAQMVSMHASVNSSGFLELPISISKCLHFKRENLSYQPPSSCSERLLLLVEVVVDGGGF